MTEYRKLVRARGSEISLPDNAVLLPLVADMVNQAYVDGLNDLEVNQFLESVRNNIQTMRTVKDYVEMNDASGGSVLLGFFLEDELSGTVRLYDVVGNTACIGIAIFNRAAWGKGWGEKLIRAAVLYAFDEIGLDMVYAGIDKNNIASAKAFMKSGFCRNSALDRDLKGSTIERWEIMAGDAGD